MIVLHGNEIVGLYLMLKKHEIDLDENLSKVFVRLEKILFENLSIDEMERLPQLYKNGAEVLE